MRDPFLHIRRSSLIKILKELDFKQPINTMADQLFNLAQPYQVRDKYLIVAATAKSTRKMQKSLEAENPIIEKFNGILASVRIELKHKRVKPILKMEKDYIMLKEIAKLAYDFAEDFDIKPRSDGYREYCKAGIEMMGRGYALNKFKTYHNSIVEIFTALEALSEDEDVAATLEFYATWQAMMLEYSELGDQIYIEKEPKKYVHMLFGRAQADLQQADYEHWLRAQFEGMAFHSAIPELTQLHGDNAVKRYERYCRQGVEGATDETLKTTDENLGDYYKKLQ